jgi:hypothetical protein
MSSTRTDIGSVRTTYICKLDTKGMHFLCDMCDAVVVVRRRGYRTTYATSWMSRIRTSSRIFPSHVILGLWLYVVDLS